MIFVFKMVILMQISEVRALHREPVVLQIEQQWPWYRPKGRDPASKLQGCVCYVEMPDSEDRQNEAILPPEHMMILGRPGVSGSDPHGRLAFGLDCAIRVWSLRAPLLEEREAWVVALNSNLKNLGGGGKTAAGVSFDEGEAMGGSDLH